MRLDYTPAVERAMRLAAHLARADQAEAVRTVDLVRALLAEEEGQAAALLERAGVLVEDARQLFPFAIPAETSDDVLPLAVVANEALLHAGELARLHGAERSIGSDQLLFAVLEADQLLRGALESAGLDWPSLKESVAPAEEPIELDEAIDFTPPTEAIDLARILDAAANRAREALRVLEDYARFALDDAFLTGALKAMRHDLAEALAQHSERELLPARDTPGDVGVSISTLRESERTSLAAVVAANAKRLQEALRSLEEFGKIHGAAFGQAIEQIRYQAYTLEKALALGGAARERLAHARLYVIVTEDACRASLLGTVSEALAGGAQIIQLREKNKPDRELLEKASAVREMTRKAGVLFIVNDRPDLALLAEADGVHLGQEDMPLRKARRLLGPEALIGVSTHNLDQVRQAVLDGASYIGVGPTFPSHTKEFADFPGLDFVRGAAMETSLPAFVLGGVTTDNVSHVLAAGGKRVAVSQAVCGSENPKEAAAKLRSALG